MGNLVGLLFLMVCFLGAYALEKEGFVKSPAYFVSWGYLFGLLAAWAMRWAS